MKWLPLLRVTAGLIIIGGRVARAARLATPARIQPRPVVADPSATSPPPWQRRIGWSLPLALTVVLSLTLILTPTLAELGPSGLPALSPLSWQPEHAQLEGSESPHGPFDAATGKCTACHSSHTATEPGLLQVPNDEASQNQVCTRCHGPTGGAAEVSTHSNKDYTDATQDPFYQLCADCHDPHSTPNDAPGDGVNDHLILTSIDSLTVRLDAQSGEDSYDDGFDDGEHDSICVACHTATAHNTSTSTELRGQGHNPVGTDCTTCHSHGEDISARSGFMPTRTPTATPTLEPSPTAMPSSTATSAPSPTPSDTPSPPFSPTSSPTATSTATPTPSPTATPTATPTSAPVETLTPTPTDVPPDSWEPGATSSSTSPPSGQRWQR